EFHHTLFTRARYGTAHFSMSSHGPRVRVEAEFSCRPQDMVVAPYVDPDGEPSWCANTEVADVRVSVHRRAGIAGWRRVTGLHAQRCGHFEVGGRTRDPSIAAEHVAVSG